MTTYKVGPGGSDANDGLTWATRFLTIGKAALTVAAGGDTCHIGPGTYREQVTFSVSGDSEYTTGTVTVNYGSTTVTGAGTNFTGAGVAIGHYFKSGKAGAIRISAVNSATELILDTAYDGPSEAGITYVTFSPIHWIGDYSGANTDGVGGIVRITGSADDIGVTRTYCITSGAGINYQRIIGIAMDLAITLIYPSTSAGRGWIIDKCHFQIGQRVIQVAGANQKDFTIQNCYTGAFAAVNDRYAFDFLHSVTVNNAQHIIQNCIVSNSFVGNNAGGIGFNRVGGNIVKNSLISGNRGGVRVLTALTVGQTITVSNCNFIGNTGNTLDATVLGEIIEDYNNFYGNYYDRSNVAVGANSLAYPPLFDTRWWFELVA